MAANSEELKSLERIVEKLDDSIDKLTEVSSNISKLLAVQEQRMNTIEKDTDRNQDDIRHIYGKLDTMTKDLSDKIDQSMKNSAEGHERIMIRVDEKVKALDARVKVLEVWRWLVIGGALVVGYLVNKLYR
jgi:cell division protein ZapA (FtsZ GTPase activity inhibitor)